MAGRGSEQQVALHGARLALKTLNQALTYDQLNRAANRLSRAISTDHRAGQATNRSRCSSSTNGADHGEPGGAQDRPACPDRRQLPQARAARLIEDAGARAIVTDGRHYRGARFGLPAAMLSRSISTRSKTISPTAISG